MCNGFASIFITVNTIVAEVRNDAAHGATANGSLRYSANGISLNANIHAGGGTFCIYTNAANTFYFVGNAYGGAGTNHRAIVLDSACTLYVTGDLYGGAGTDASGLVVINNPATTVHHTGNCYSNNGCGLDNQSACTVNSTGMAYGGAGVRAGIRNFSTGTAILTGNAIAGAGAQGVFNNDGGSFTVTGYAQASTTVAGANNRVQGILQVGETRSASNGRGAVTGAFRFASATAAKSMPYTPDGQISMTVLDVAAIVPAESDVRRTVVYGDGAYTGTLPLGRARTSMAGRF